MANEPGTTDLRDAFEAGWTEALSLALARGAAYCDMSRGGVNCVLDEIERLAHAGPAAMKEEEA